MAYVVFFVQVHSIINIAGNSMVKRSYFQKKKKHFFEMNSTINQRKNNINIIIQIIDSRIVVEEKTKI